MWKKYGVIGLSFAGPPIAGIHLTALVAAVVDHDGRRTIGWLTVGLAGWSGVLVVGYVVGISAIGLL